MSEQARQLYRFDVFEFDLRKRLLWRNGTLVPLPPKVAETLALLVEHEDDVVEKQELLSRVWPDTVVEENSLTQNISVLRKALGSQPDGRQYIETVAKRGYRFVNGTVQEPRANGDDSWSPGSEMAGAVLKRLEPAPKHYTFQFRISRRSLWLASLAAAMVFVIIGLFIHSAVTKQSATPVTAADRPIIGVHPKWYDFEDGVEGWISASSGMITQLVSSGEHSYKGHRSLAISFAGPFKPKTQVYTLGPKIPAGYFVMAHIWCPRENNLTSIALFVEEGNGSWDNDWEPKSNIDFGSWTGFRVLVPTDAVTPVRRVGVEFTSHAEWKGTCYVDSVEWVPSW